MAAASPENDEFHCENEEEDDEDFSDISGFDEDMEALRRACIRTGITPAEQLNDLRGISSLSENSIDMVGLQNSNGGDGGGAVYSESESDGDFELVRSIKNRFSLMEEDRDKNLFSNPFMDEDDTEDEDFEILRAVQRRFEAYNNGSPLNNGRDATATGKFSSMLPLRFSSFPKSAQVFIDAIKKNRSYQEFIRTKLTQIEARLEENKKLRQRVKILRDLQVACKRITGRMLSQGKEGPCIQLISARLGDGEKVSSAIHYGPLENSHVANYRAALAKFPITFHRNKWKEVEKQNLVKGIRQQFQKMMLLQGAEEELCSLDDILTSIRDVEITPQQVREFLPKVNWDDLASLYVTGRSGAECKARWLNFEDPLIKRNPWNAEEDKHLLHILKEKGITNWFDIAVSLGTNRTPHQCLSRFQRSLNACVLKREWSKEDDARLCSAVEAFGENRWQDVACALEGRTGSQCSNRWRKSLHPDRQKVGRWAKDEDKRLRVAAMIFGQKNWNEIAKFVPGRTQAQCRERWVNSLNPSVHLGRWTEEEDSQLQAAIAEHGYCWSKVASCLRSRTDNQCWRRWKVLVPDEVFRLQQVRKIKKLALIGNFVDRESERPALGPNDFKPTNCSAPESETENRPQKNKRRLRKKIRFNGTEEEIHRSSDGIPATTTNSQVETVCDSQVTSPNCEPVDKNKRDKRFLKRKSRNNDSTEENGKRPSLFVSHTDTASLDSGMTSESTTRMYGQDFTSMIMATNGEDAGVDGASVKERKRTRKQKKHIVLNENINDLELPLQVIEPGNTDVEDVSLEQGRRRRKRVKQNGPKSSKQIEQTADDDILLSSLVHKKGKKRSPKRKERAHSTENSSCSATVPFELDGCESDDIPLASFLLKRCKKSNKNKTFLLLDKHSCNASNALFLPSDQRGGSLKGVN